MKVLVAGAGRLGAQIAQVLAAAHNDVTLVDLNEHRIAELEGHLPVRLVAGDACEARLLEHAGAHTTDLVIAATGDDEDNLVISLLAKRRFAVARVAARVNDEENTWLFDHRWGVDVAVPATGPLISLIEEATGATDTVALLRLSKAGVNVIETAITPQSHVAAAPSPTSSSPRAPSSPPSSEPVSPLSPRTRHN
ncbi:NAD-binding protein [Streptomyces sp. NBC_00452]|uniref:potassium channel family protein n=1 Tax=Streptomyces sp. NBC_00452 TaxID=2975746 RepID=UPI002254F624|nr:NAD-binding protein [Streptomyces sp. NBC_00452]MCX5063461.1 NAD-binding protein [Streptomyces sp. NBC_00452]